VQSKLGAVEAELARTELATATLTQEIASINTTLDVRTQAQREAERESANSGAALRQMDAEAARIQARLQQWQLAVGRNNDQRQQRQDLIARKRDEAGSLEAQRQTAEALVAELTEKIAALRLSREELQLAASAAAAALAGLEERRRNANANFEQTRRLFESQTQRIAQLDHQIAAAAGEKQSRESEGAGNCGERDAFFGGFWSAGGDGRAGHATAGVAA